jgi:hypothetical protein
MPLPLPNLDDRRWADLVDEGRALISRFAPDWTDHNVHDPGITLIELFAWLTEMTVYRLNRVPDRHRRKFLSLIDYAPHTPQAAHTVLTFDPDPGTAPFEIPAGAEFEAATFEGLPIRFRTLRNLTVSVANLAVVQVEEIDASGTATIHDRTRDWRDALPMAPFGDNPQPGAAFYLGFNDLPAEVPITLGFRFEGPGNGTNERERIVHEAKAQREACRPALPNITCDPEESETKSSNELVPPHHSAHLVWEVFTGTDPSDPKSWAGLDPIMEFPRPVVGQVMDDTRSMTLDGMVEVNLPPTIVQTALANISDPLFYVRCRLITGSYDAAPTLIDVLPNSVRAQQCVPVFQRFTIAVGVTPSGPAPTPGEAVRLKMAQDPTGIIQALTFLEPENTLEQPDITVLSFQAPAGGSIGHITLEIAQVGSGDGRPSQQATLPQAPVLVDSLHLYTHRGDIWQEWTRREDFDASVRTDFHFVLDATNGEIAFGDGERGQVPRAGTLILAVYRATRAERGNPGAGTVTQTSATPGNTLWLAGLTDVVSEQLPRIVSNPGPARGGASAEALSGAISRAVETLYAHQRLLDLCAETKCHSLDQLDRQRVRGVRSPTRAVNLLDIERLALDVPGTCVARARAWAGVHSAFPCLHAPGVVTVVVLPDMPIAKPEPSAGLVEAIRRFLNRRRMLTTRLVVVGPEYLEVQVHARVRRLSHINSKGARKRIEEALTRFLDPRRGGPDGLGWPFGRDVYRSEILQLIDGVHGVDHVLELTLMAGGGQSRCGNISLCPTWLVTPGKHEIEVV